MSFEKFILQNRIENFQITSYFLTNFVKRILSSYITLHGEAASADLSKIDEFKLAFKEKTEQYPMANIFNCWKKAGLIEEVSNEEKTETEIRLKKN
jgi:hypothetical protein